MVDDGIAANLGDRKPTRGRVRLRLEQWGKNPTCETNLVSAIRDVDMAKVAQAFGIKASSAPSELALRNGKFFEQLLFRDGASVLLDLLRDLDDPVIDETEQLFLDHRLTHEGGSHFTLLADVVTAGEQALKTLASLRAGDPLPMALVAGFSVQIPEAPPIPEATYILDVLTVRRRNGKVELTVGEVKDYPDRGGYTESRGLATARIQAGAYVFALRHCIDRLGLSEGIIVRDLGFIVLTKPGQPWPQLLPKEDLRYQAERAQRGFKRIRELIAALPEGSLAADPPSSPPALRAFFAETIRDYGPTCAHFCPMADECHRSLLDQEDPLALGSETKELLGMVPIGRAAELLKGAPGDSPEELELLRRLEQSGLDIR